jgi:hypothetical protein
MRNKLKSSEAGLLQKFDIALENAGTQPEISAEMGELGYDVQKIDEGKSLMVATRAVYKTNQTEDDETSEAYAGFSDKKKQLGKTFKKHRKKVRVVFAKDPLTTDRLAISGAYPRTYVRWIESTVKFYDETTVDTDVQAKLARLKVTPEELAAGKTLVGEVKSARATYLREIGESEAATKQKDAAIAEMEDWMREFYAVAEIALEDNPQLLEALGKIVKS